MEHQMPLNLIKSILRSDSGQAKEVAGKIKAELDNPGVTIIFR
jgi:hypothetical protein